MDINFSTQNSRCNSLIALLKLNWHTSSHCTKLNVSARQSSSNSCQHSDVLFRALLTDDFQKPGAVISVHKLLVIKRSYSVDKILKYCHLRLLRCHFSILPAKYNTNADLSLSIVCKNKNCIS